MVNAEIHLKGEHKTYWVNDIPEGGNKLLEFLTEHGIDPITVDDVRDWLVRNFPFHDFFENFEDHRDCLSMQDGKGFRIKLVDDTTK